MISGGVTSAVGGNATWYHFSTYVWPIQSKEPDILEILLLNFECLILRERQTRGYCKKNSISDSICKVSKLSGSRKRENRLVRKPQTLSLQQYPTRVLESHSRYSYRLVLKWNLHKFFFRGQMIDFEFERNHYTKAKRSQSGPMKV